MLAVLVASAALTASQTLLNFARSGPLYVSSAAQRTELEKLCSDAVAEAAESPAWPRDAALLCQPWDLIATTNAAVAGPILPRMDADPSMLGAVAVSQSFQQAESFRCDNILKVSRPENTWTSAWTLLPTGGESSLRLEHAATVVAAQTPLKISLSLDRISLDGNRRAGDAPEEIIALPTPPLPPFLRGTVGQFEVVLLSEDVYVTRGAASPFGDSPALRIFARPPTAHATATPEGSIRSAASVAPRSRGGAPSMLAGRRQPPKPPARRSAASPSTRDKQGGGLDPTIPSLIYYGVYTAVFGKMLLVLVERLVT